MYFCMRQSIDDCCVCICECSLLGQSSNYLLYLKGLMKQKQVFSGVEDKYNSSNWYTHLSACATTPYKPFIEYNSFTMLSPSQFETPLHHIFDQRYAYGELAFMYYDGKTASISEDKIKAKKYFQKITEFYIPPPSVGKYQVNVKKINTIDIVEPITSNLLLRELEVFNSNSKCYVINHNAVRAFKIYEMSASYEDHYMAQFVLGRCYHLGSYLCSVNHKLALKLYTSASKGNCKIAAKKADEWIRKLNTQNFH